MLYFEINRLVLMTYTRSYIIIQNIWNLYKLSFAEDFLRLFLREYGVLGDKYSCKDMSRGFYVRTF